MTRLHRYVAAAVAVFAVFVASYVYAATGSGDARTAPLAVAPAIRVTCACCGSSGPATTGEATVRDGVQRMVVDTSSGRWDPNEIGLVAGVPARITFSEGQGCLASVIFPDLGLEADLTRGGATLDVPALAPGEYAFSCGMRMVFGKLVVR